LSWDPIAPSDLVTLHLKGDSKMSSGAGSGVGSGAGSKFPGLKELGRLKEKVFDKPHLDQIRRKIRKHIQRSEKSSEKFITAKSLQEIWRFELVEFLKGLGLDKQEQYTFIDKNLLKTLSILVHIRWDDWPKFTEIFMEGQGFRKDRVDSKLPYDLAILQEESFLGGGSGEDFSDSQYIFIPIILTQGKIDTYPIERRLPLNTGGRVLGKGAFGKVMEEVIPQGQLILMSGGKEVSFPKSHRNIN
jgi:hypothetical protein